MLKHEADAALAHADIGGLGAVKMHRARIRQLEARNNSQQGGFAGAGHAEQRDQLAGFDLEAYVVERDEVAESFADVADLDTHAAIFSVLNLLGLRAFPAW